jgi:outer membrane protein assembly factor BamB
MRISKTGAMGLTAWLLVMLWVEAQFPCRAQVDPTIVWKLELMHYAFVTSSPAIAPDGTIYQATFTGKLLAVTPQGTEKWMFKAGRQVTSTPAIGDDGTVYFGSRDRKCYAVTPQGRLKWTFQTGAWVDSSPAIGADGTIYFGSWDTNFYALHPDGSRKWVFPTGGIIDSSPAIGADGTIYFGSHDKRFYALKPDGTLRWSFATGSQIISSPAMAGDGTIYFSSVDGNVYALNPDGTEHWRLHTGGVTKSSPVLDGQGNLYLSVNQDNVSISRDGKIRWALPFPAFIYASPAAAASGEIYFSAPWRCLLAVTQDGREVWRLTTDENNQHEDITTSPVIAGDGTIYIAHEDWLEAIHSTNRLAPAAKSSWPMFRANPRRTGRVEP